MIFFLLNMGFHRVQVIARLENFVKVEFICAELLAL